MRPLNAWRFVYREIRQSRSNTPVPNCSTFSGKSNRVSALTPQRQRTARRLMRLRWSSGNRADSQGYFLHRRSRRSAFVFFAALGAQPPQSLAGQVPL
jgi:hypothetical protein